MTSSVVLGPDVHQGDIRKRDLYSVEVSQQAQTRRATAHGRHQAAMCPAVQWPQSPARTMTGALRGGGGQFSQRGGRLLKPSGPQTVVQIGRISR